MSYFSYQKILFFIKEENILKENQPKALPVLKDVLEFCVFLSKHKNL